MAEVENKRSSINLSEVDIHSKNVKAVKNVALAEAVEMQKPNMLTKSMLTLYFFLFIATLNSCINGYDGSLMGAINTYPQYRKYFGFDPNAGTPGTGIVYAIYTIGNLVGSFAAGPAADIKGRKWGMFLGALIIVIGTCIQASCHNLAGFMAGRFILGFGVAICASAGPTYAVEMAHPAFRGTMTGIYNTFWFVGGIPGSFVPYGTSTIQGNNSWRIPIWLQMVFSGFVVIGAPFLPETPRWLIANDRHEDALTVMAKYHGEGDRNSPIVQLEYKEMLEDIKTTSSDKRWWDYRELFNTPEVRYRTFLVLCMGIFGQWSGNGPVSYYYPQMLAGAGINDKHTQLLLNGMQNVVSFGGAITGAIFTDSWGRRPQLLISIAIITLLFVLIMALNATNLSPNPAYGKDPSAGKFVAKRSSQAKAIIALIFIFGFVFGVGWTPLQALYPVECLRYESRAKGMGLYNFAVNIASFYNTFVTGIAFDRAGWKYYLLFIFWDTFEFLVIYFFFVETKKRTLEEITEIMRGSNRVKRSTANTKVVLHGKEGVTKVIDDHEEQ